MQNLPKLQKLTQFRYWPLPTESRIDSSAATPKDWHNLAKTIYDVHACYAGFIVFHGTDTLAYTSAALAFLLVGHSRSRIDKPIIVTGAQVPVLQARTDAVNNFLGALQFATWRDKSSGDNTIVKLAGAFVFFNNKLMRATTVVKVDSQRWDAFDSPRVPLVGEIKDGGAMVERQHGVVAVQFK